jgi:BMFP domain-containing protein YqiC
MAKSPAGELLSTLKSYISQLSDGERTPTEVAAALNDWARESAESIKSKVAEEVEATVSKMGFVKREEYELLLARIATLESGKTRVSSRAGSTKKNVSKKVAPTEVSKKKAPVKKAVAKKITKKASSK